MVNLNIKPISLKDFLTTFISMGAVFGMVMSVVSFIYMPRIENLIKDTIKTELRNPSNRVFIECLIRTSQNRMDYATTAEMLRIFENIPNGERTSFHTAEILRLKDKKQLLLSTLGEDFNHACMNT